MRDGKRDHDSDVGRDLRELLECRVARTDAHPEGPTFSTFSHCDLSNSVHCQLLFSLGLNVLRGGYAVHHLPVTLILLEGSLAEG